MRVCEHMAVGIFIDLLVSKIIPKVFKLSVVKSASRGESPLWEDLVVPGCLYDMCSSGLSYAHARAPAHMGAHACACVIGYACACVLEGVSVYVYVCLENVFSIDTI